MKFTGHERDFNGILNVDGTDYLDYMHARFYDANIGRFLSVDPGRDWDVRQPQSWNLYAYVRNNPANAVDPTGRQQAAPKKENDSSGELTPEDVEAIKKKERELAKEVLQSTELTVHIKYSSASLTGVYPLGTETSNAQNKLTLTLLGDAGVTTKSTQGVIGPPATFEMLFNLRPSGSFSGAQTIIKDVLFGGALAGAFAKLALPPVGFVTIDMPAAATHQKFKDAHPNVFPKPAAKTPDCVSRSMC